jgi:hypothetical protein
VLVTPSDETSELDVQLVDDHARVIGRGTEDGRDRSAVVCSPLSTDVTLELRPRIAAGIAAVVVAHSVPGSEPDIQAHVERLEPFPARPLADARAALSSKLKAAGYDPAPLAQATGAAGTGHRASFTVALPKGCSRVDVIAGAPLAGVVAELWSDVGTLLTHAEGGAGATLFACGDAQKARVDVEATARPGPLAIEARKERSTDATLLSSGVAGGRLLARVNAVGEIVPSDALDGFHLLPLDAATRKSIDLRVPAASCLEVAAAAALGGAGVDVRLVDAATGDEIGAGRAAQSTMARACAGAADVKATAEIRLTAGTADVLVAGRVTRGVR